MGFFDFLKSNNKTPSFDLSDFKFLSDDHSRFENGKPTNINNEGAWRGIRIKTSDNITFYVTMYNMNENHPIWGDNIQMAEKRMKFIEENDNKIVLRGFGKDSMNSSFSDYGITLQKYQNNIEKITLHMFDRNIEIVYSKAKEKIKEEILPTEIKENKKSLTISQEMILVLLNPTTIAKAQNLIGKIGSKFPIDSYDMNFRLITANEGNVNLELLAQNDLGMYFKPIGFFTNSNEGFTITILKEFEEDYKSLESSLEKSFLVNFLTLKENAFIAAASKDAVSAVMKMFKSPKYVKFAPPTIENMQFEKIYSNGLIISIRSSMMGALETNIEGDEAEEMDDTLLIMYQNNNGISLHTSDSEFYDMQNKGLLTAFNVM